MELENTVILGGLRTAFAKATDPLSGKPNTGAFAKIEPLDAAVTVTNTLLDRTGVNPEDVEKVIMGVVNQEGKQGLNLARQIMLHADSKLPLTVEGEMVDKFCASSLRAIDVAAGDIVRGNANLILAGGLQFMGLVPMTGENPYIPPKVEENIPKGSLNMGITAENVAELYGISREEQDAFALASHKKAAAAQEAGYFKDEILPLAGLDHDNCVRTDSSMEALAKLKPAFKKDGTVTGGSSSAFTDGVAFVLLASESYAKENNLPVKARIVASAGVGLAPEIMGMGPVEATKKALARAGLTMADIGAVELNEAFAAQSLGVLEEFNRQGMAIEPYKLNVDGGAIAIGHPLGATGARMITHLTNVLERTGERYGLATLCVGQGQGYAMVIENPNYTKPQGPKL